MTDLVTTWQTSLQTVLEAAFPTAEILIGERDAVSRDKDRAAIFTRTTLKAWAPNVNNATIPMTIRFWKALPKLSALENVIPRDPTPLQALAATLEATLKAHLTSISGIDYMHVEQIVQDVNDEYGVEVQLTGWTRNPAESGG